MTVARFHGFDSRATAGLIAPRSISRNIAPVGVTWHYVGPAVTFGTHAGCRSTWRNIQIFHMDNGYVDVAYSCAVCHHGIILAGRGAGIRTGANGTDAANRGYYAVVALAGEGQTPTAAMLDGLHYATLDLRRSSVPAGLAVKPHSLWRSTKCPGNPLRHRAAQVDGRIITLEDTMPDAQEVRAIIREELTELMRRPMGSSVDGVPFQTMLQRDYVYAGETLGIVRSLAKAIDGIDQVDTAALVASIVDALGANLDEIAAACGKPAGSLTAADVIDELHRRTAG